MTHLRLLAAASAAALSVTFTAPGRHTRLDVSSPRVARGDTLSWLASVLPTYGTFDYATVTTSPIAHSQRRIESVRSGSCTLAFHITLRAKSLSDIEDSVSLAAIPSDSLTVTQLTGTTIQVGQPVAVHYDPPFWEVATVGPDTAHLVVVHDRTSGRQRSLPVLALYIDTEVHAHAVATALRAAIRECRPAR
jgi:hypothetical protein